MPEPFPAPIGLRLNQTARAVERAFDEALAEAGEAAFLRLRAAAMAFDARLRDGLAQSDLATLGTLLARLAANVGAPAEPAPPWAGLADHGTR